MQQDADGDAESGFRSRVQTGATVWRQQIRTLTEENAVSARAFGRQYGFSSRTVLSWLTKESGTPSLPIMLQLHETGLYPIADQMSDLFGLSAGDLVPTLPLWEPQPALGQLTDALERALGRSVATQPSLHEVAAAVNEYCEDSGSIGRWRSRFFDVPMGWHFPHVGFRGVEFMRWYGPNSGEDRAPDVARRFLELDELGTSQWWAEQVGGRFLAPEPPPAFRPHRLAGAPMGDDDRHDWQQCRLERPELIKRIGPSLNAAVVGTWLGAYGTLHTPLLRHAEQNPTGRHIFLQPIMSARPTSGEREVLAPFHTILVLGPGSLTPTRIGDLVAQALGWLGVDYRQFAQRLAGRRVSLAQERGDRDARAMAYLASTPPPQPMVVSSNVHYFTDQRHEALGPSPEARVLLQTPGVLPILLTHGPENDTSDYWEARQRAGTANPESVSAFNQADTARNVMETWAVEFDQLPAAFVVEVRPELPWAGPATMRRGARVPSWFAHPLIGDIQIRAAYELATQLRGGTIPARAPGGLRAEFAPNSTVHRFARILSRVTGGPHLEWDLRFDEKYLTSPSEPPPVGRVLAMSRTMRRT